MSRTRLIFMTLTLIFLCTFQAAADIYKTVDKNGRTVYTDLPPADTTAKALELQKINTVPKTEVTSGAGGVGNSQSVAKSSYAVAIVSPEDGLVLKVEERSLYISARLNKGLEDGDEFVFMIDGTTIEQTNEPDVTLSEPPRASSRTAYP